MLLEIMSIIADLSKYPDRPIRPAQTEERSGQASIDQSRQCDNGIANVSIIKGYFDRDFCRVHTESSIDLKRSSSHQ
jgi:hypothetical protein